MKWLWDDVKESLDELILCGKGALLVEVEAFFASALGMTCAYMRMPAEGVATQGWILGTDAGAPRPPFLDEFALIHALIIARGFPRREPVPPG